MNFKTPRHVDEEVLERARKRRCVACGRWPSDPAHIKTRGSGGGDYDWNVMPLCRIHHTEQHQIGFHKFAYKYLGVRLEMIDLGWTEERGKLFHPALSRI